MLSDGVAAIVLENGWATLFGPGCPELRLRLRSCGLDSSHPFREPKEKAGRRIP